MNNRFYRELITLLLALIVVTPLIAQRESTIKRVKSKPSEVTLFLSGAEVRREARVDLPKGESQLILEGLSPYLKQNTLQLYPKGALSISSVSFQQNLLANLEGSQEIKRLEGLLKEVERSIEGAELELSVIASEIGFLEENRKISSSVATTSIASLEQAASQYSKVVGRVKEREQRVKERLEKLQKEESALKEQIKAERRAEELPSGEILLSLNAAQSGSYILEFVYTVERASWRALYTISVDNLESPLSLQYRAAVSQTTGENWEEVKLKLSSANPNLSGEAPKLSPYYLQFEEDRVSTPVAQRALLSKSIMADSAPQYMGSQLATPREGITSIQFELNRAQTLNSSTKEEELTLNKIELPANYSYFTIPKLENQLFLKAELADWEQYNLLPGEASLFFEGGFVAKSYLNTREAEENLELSLGRDREVSVKRERVKSYSTKQLIGSKQQQEQSWKITIKNGKSSPIKLLVMDQVPISSNQEIEVTLKGGSPTSYNDATGEIQWLITLEPYQSHEIEFSYLVSYPKSKKITFE